MSPIKKDWMREIEIQHGWADLWEGAWIRTNGRWARIETLADLWAWSDQPCPCCGEPKLLTPDNRFLVCQWTNFIDISALPAQISAGNVYQGISSYPCPVCYGDIWETRMIGEVLTTKNKHCLSCGYLDRSTREITAIDYLPIGYTGRIWKQQTEFQTISGQLAEIKQLLQRNLAATGDPSLSPEELYRFE